MLKKRNRISRKKELEEVKVKGEMYHSPILGLRLMRKDDEEIKWGWIVSKRISKKAVERNRVKRVLAESLRKHWERMEKGWRGLIFVKRNILTWKSSKVEEEIERMVNKIRSAGR